MSTQYIEQMLRNCARPDQVELIVKRAARDEVIGVRMSDVFDIAKKHRDLELEAVRMLLRSH